MTTSLEGFTFEEEITVLRALSLQMLKYLALLERDDYWFYRRKIETIYSIFNKMGYTKEEADRFITFEFEGL